MGATTIENHPQKALIVRRIIEGLPVRAVCNGLSPAVTFMSIQRYKANKIKPMLAHAEASNRILSVRKGELVLQTPPEPLSTDTKAVTAVTSAIQAAPVLSIFRTRLEGLHDRIERNLNRVEANPKEYPMLPPLVNQLHKNLELLGKVTGELEQQGTTSVSIQIVCPSAPTPELTPRISYADDNATTYTASEISVTQLPPD